MAGAVWGRMVAGLAVWLLVLVALAPVAPAQDLSALARLDAKGSAVRDAGAGIELRLAISQPVPWRVRLMADPPRLVLDMREVDWRGLPEMPRQGVRVRDLRAGVFRPGWSRLVAELSGPFTVTQAGMATGTGGAVVTIRLDPATPPAFAARAAMADPPDWTAPDPADLPRPEPRGTGPLVVVLDPGHGGLDPGAEFDGQTEADLMLIFARTLKEEFLRQGGALVVLTRDEDAFVPLETRISIARAAGAHVFLSLHADALAEGQASGATLYTLSDEASDKATATLAERHDRDDLLAGVDLTEQDDLVAQVLMDMARTETAPRIDRLAGALETAIKAEGLAMHRKPRQAGGFSVLKSPDIPSVLIELGYLTSPRDLRRLTDPDWRDRMARAIRAGVMAWAAEDAALAGLPR
ncbi:MAG: N-acetylmuramoyl-L-alanine amidase [Gemmobacter sp.]